MAKWDVNNIYEFACYLTNKNAVGGISPTDLFYAWNAEQNALQSDLLGQWENRSNGKSGQATGLIQNQTIKQLLAPFVITEDITIASDAAEKPEDFIYEVGLRISATGGTAGSKLDKINHDQIYAVNRSVLDAPSVVNNNYYCVEYANSAGKLIYSLLPLSMAGTVHLDYVAQCRDIKWGYTFDAQGQQLYNSGTSIQPKWNQNTIVTITKRAIKSLGLRFDDKDFENFGNSNIATGN